MAHDYKGRVIHVAPELSQGGRWCPIVSITTGGIVHLPPVPADLMFDSAEEAKESGYQFALQWIDTQA
jgi:hypothetical protein